MMKLFLRTAPQNPHAYRDEQKPGDDGELHAVPDHRLGKALALAHAPHGEEYYDEGEHEYDVVEGQEEDPCAIIVA